MQNDQLLKNEERAVIALRDEDASGIRVTAEEGRPVAALAGWD